MGYLICHHSGSLPCRYVGIPTAVVSGLTLNTAFSIYLPCRFSAIYFSAEAQRRSVYEFDIPFSRQQLADYLGVERSGLSVELGKMRDEGLLDFHKSHFLLKAPETDGLSPSAR